MSRRSDAPFERANKPKTLEVTLNAPLVLLNMGEDHACFFLREQVNHRTGIRCSNSWIDGNSWDQCGWRLHLQVGKRNIPLRSRRSAVITHCIHRESCTHSYRKKQDKQDRKERRVFSQMRCRLSVLHGCSSWHALVWHRHKIGL